MMLDKGYPHPYNMMVREYVSGIFAPIFRAFRTGRPVPDCQKENLTAATTG